MYPAGLKGEPLHLHKSIGKGVATAGESRLSIKQVVGEQASRSERSEIFT